MSESPLPHRIAFLGDYVPRICGIATFTQDLCEAVACTMPDTDCFVAAVNDRPEGYAYPARVRLELQEKELDSYRRAADFLNFNNADVLCVQHEFGIYGGQDKVIPDDTAHVLKDLFGDRYTHVVHPDAGHVSYVFSDEIWRRDHPKALDPNPMDLIEQLVS